MSQNSDRIVCKICNFIFDQPILLPCNRTICEVHLQDLDGCLQKNYKCLLCRKMHDIPEEGFPINKSIENVIKSNLHLKDDEKILKLQFEKSIKHLERVFKVIDKAEANISQHFTEIKKEINLQRKNLKLKIDNIADKMILNANKYEEAYKFDVLNNEIKSINGLSFKNFKFLIENELRRVNFQMAQLKQMDQDVNKKIKDLEEKLDYIINFNLNTCTFCPCDSFEFEEHMFGKFDIKYQLLVVFADGKLKLRDVDSEFYIKSYAGNIRGITSIEITRDNKRIISSTREKTINIWDIKTGKCLNTLENFNSSVLCLKNTSSLNEFASGSVDCLIKIWNLDTGVCKNVLRGHFGRIICLEYLASENLLISGSSDSKIKVWDLNTYNCIRTLESHRKAVVCLEKTSKTKFASGSSDSTLKFWDAYENRCLDTLHPKTGCIVNLKLNSPNTLISCSRAIQIWDLVTHTCIKTLSREIQANYKCLEILSSQKVIAISNFDTEIWDIQKHQLVSRQKHDKNRPVYLRKFYPI